MPSDSGHEPSNSAVELLADDFFDHPLFGSFCGVLMLCSSFFIFPVLVPFL